MFGGPDLWSAHVETDGLRGQQGRPRAAAHYPAAALLTCGRLADSEVIINDTGGSD